MVQAVGFTGAWTVDTTVRSGRGGFVPGAGMEAGCSGKVMSAQALRCCCGLEEKAEEELLSCGLDRGKEEDLVVAGWWIGRRLRDCTGWAGGSGGIPMWSGGGRKGMMGQAP